MKKTILVAGATGNLGGRIVKALTERGAEVHALVRTGADPVKILQLEKAGAKIVYVDMDDATALSLACNGIGCIVSALQGLHDVIIDTQGRLLNAAIAAGVPRFIPSDYSTDYTDLPEGENRNFDLRREFHKLLDTAGIRHTSIFNGAFAEILTYGTPLLDLKKKTVGYWGDDPDWQMDFTTMDDTVAYTACAAMDDEAPESLRIAGFRISPRGLSETATAAFGNAFPMVPMGSLDDFAAYIRRERAAHPEGEQELYPRWQSSQYMHGMFTTHHSSVDNDRYTGITWTDAADTIKKMHKLA